MFDALLLLAAPHVCVVQTCRCVVSCSTRLVVLLMGFGWLRPSMQPGSRRDCSSRCKSWAAYQRWVTLGTNTQVLRAPWGMAGWQLAKSAVGCLMLALLAAGQQGVLPDTNPQPHSI